jgi:hypothetical protein
MARYSHFLGRLVDVQYRAGEVFLNASGTFVADCGRSVFLEQSFTQNGKRKHFRWEIPYQYIVRLDLKRQMPDESEPATANGTAQVRPQPMATGAPDNAPACSPAIARIAQKVATSI